jgi:hypothetical protein
MAQDLTWKLMRGLLSTAVAFAMLSAPASFAQRPSQQRRRAQLPEAQRPEPPQGVPGRKPIMPVIRYVQGSTTKLEQLIGDEDKQLHQPTLSRTVTRYKLEGTDLGYSFENNGSVVFLFGDTVGALDKAFDTMATTDARDPERGVRLDFLTSFNRPYLTISPNGINMGAFNTPAGGIEIEGQTYVVVKTDHSEDQNHPTNRSVLTKYHPSSIILNPSWFETGRTISRLPGGHFINMSLHAQPGPIAGLPGSVPFIMMWGTGWYRHSDAYLAFVPVPQFATGKGTLYFKGFDNAGAPTWSQNESDANPIVKNGTMGDLSVTWCEPLSLWLMTYDSRSPAQSGIQFQYSRTPWGPWSKPQVLFNATTDGAYGKFIHDPAIHPDDGLEGPVIGKGQKNPGRRKGRNLRSVCR